MLFLTDMKWNAFPILQAAMSIADAGIRFRILDVVPFMLRK